MFLTLAKASASVPDSTRGGREDGATDYPIGRQGNPLHQLVETSGQLTSNTCGKYPQHDNSTPLGQNLSPHNRWEDAALVHLLHIWVSPQMAQNPAISSLSLLSS